MEEAPPLRKISSEEIQKSINGSLHGRYNANEFGLCDDARRIQALESARHKDARSAVTNVFVRLWRLTLGRWGEDWVFLALLGTLMAMLSYAMDEIVALSFRIRLWLFNVASLHVALQYLAWISFPVTVMVIAAVLVRRLGPQAAGSGLPELKAILRGGSLQGYFGFKTLIAKTFGITATLGCGMPLGREGSLIHISSIMAALLSKLMGTVDLIKDAGGKTWRYSDMLAAACAVGVATTFAAPIGGVLFSIEVTSLYFAVRNYWRGFFAAVFGAAVFRLLAVWFAKEDTVVAIYLTNFSTDFPFDPQELFAYALLGVVCGFGAAAYVWMHRQCITFVRTNRFIQQHIYLFVASTVLLTVSCTFPAGIGQFMGGDIYTVDQVKALFQNFTWTKERENRTAMEEDVLSHWNVDKVGVFSSLCIYIVFTWLFSILCSSMPVPLGNFGPVFKMGAAIGRLMGELLLVYAPSGFHFGSIFDTVIPGSYATVGAAAFSGAVTHTVSTSVIVFEMTGQVTHTFPNMIAVLLANGICAMLQPSIYDSLILIKKLPYLPHLYPKASSYLIYTKDFMLRNVKYIWHGITYGELLNIINNENDKFSCFPLVNSPDDMILVGSVQRDELRKLIDQHLGDERRLYVAAQRRLDALERKSSQSRLRSNSSSGDLSSDNLMQRSYENLFSTPSRSPDSSSQGVFNPIIGGDDCTPFRLGQKSHSFTLPRVAELPEIEQTSDQEHNTGNDAASIAASAKRAREAVRGMRRSSSTSAVLGAGALVTSDPDSFKELNEKLYSLHNSLENLNMTSPLTGDMTPEERRRWEAAELRRAVPLGLCTCIDPAPFQLVVSKPLPRVHSLFCMLGVRRAYVTHVGRLVGVVALKELCKATVDSNAGILPVSQNEVNSNKLV